MEAINGNTNFNEKIARISKIVDKIKRENKQIITLRDMVLILLYAQKDKPIHSRIMLFKEIFLLYKEILSKYTNVFILQDPKFFGYKYGPYSFELAEIIKQLYWNGLIDIYGRRNTRKETFKLTPKGEEEAHKIFSSLPKELQEDIKKMRIGWDQLGIDGILRYVYRNYPDYTKQSEIKDKYKEVLWGGRG
ncbi:hypothetical protein A3L04_06390 [Thermococcus chitonophagus]|uniref:Antitoxin SocA-like Panacea domain-containing protein n=1 Tax=Thermococcus chitonophagus TaxID=54262 RepID=A0A160VST7_9EURY|nr:hypothetical protein [Thermococcus chitonophagus]ASJ16726.1 hypothetical protein A3L04_06390 [Thermococcus chitonophagus]CUX78193.1 hypothetical protein CHITON_1414 [Thermococcus chitonophagus]